MRQNFVAQFVQLLKPWLCDVQSGIAVDKNWAHSVDQCRLQALQFSVHLINLLSIILRCNDFARIQKAVVDQTSSRPPPNSDCDLFFGVSLALGRTLELILDLFSVQPLSWSSLVVVYSPLFAAHHNPIEKWFIVVAYKKRR